MNRELILKSQPRSYLEGTIFFMNNEWIIFDEEDSAYLLNDFFQRSVEFLISQSWETFFIQSEEHTENLSIPDGTKIRVPKLLQLAYENFLNELSDESFQQFTNNLDELDYSIFDCMICHHFLSFLQETPKIGVNFLLFDNGDLISSVHHHFIRNEGIIYDRFVFTRADGLQVEVK